MDNVNVNVVHLCSTICTASEALLVTHSHSAPYQGRLSQCRLGFEYDCCHYRHVQERNPFDQPANLGRIYIIKENKLRKLENILGLHFNFVGLFKKPTASIKMCQKCVICCRMFYSGLDVEKHFRQHFSSVLDFLKFFNCLQLQQQTKFKPHINYVGIFK